MDDDQGRMGTGALGKVKQRLGRRVAAGEGDRLLGAGCQNGKQDGNSEERETKKLHGETSIPGSLSANSSIFGIGAGRKHHCQVALAAMPQSTTGSLDSAAVNLRGVCAV